MKKILVPCDFSKQSISGLRIAANIAAMSGGEVHMVNVIELPVMHDTVLMPVLSFEEEFMRELKVKADKQFEKLQEKYGEDVKKVKGTVLYGNPSTMILKYVDDNNIDLVVMGTKGASGVHEILIGSNAEKIVRRSPVPVLTVKKYVDASSIRNIVFPSTLMHDDEDLIRNLKALQNFFDATVHLVFINTPGNFTRDLVTHDRMSEFVKRHTFVNYTTNIYNDRDEESGVINFVHFINADLIAMGTHGRKGLAHILSGSLTEDVVNHVDCPTWTYMIRKVE